MRSNEQCAPSKCSFHNVLRAMLDMRSPIGAIRPCHCPFRPRHTLLLRAWDMYGRYARRVYLLAVNLCHGAHLNKLVKPLPKGYTRNKEVMKSAGRVAAQHHLQALLSFEPNFDCCVS